MPTTRGGASIGLLVVISSRSFAFYTLLALVPLYFIDVLETSDAAANGALTGMLVAGAIGTLAGGMLADRVGRRPVLVASLLLQPPILVAATMVGAVPAVALFSLFGFVAISSFSVTIVMGQEYLPSRIGLASGFTLGAGVGIGGLAAPVFGWIGDEFGLVTSLQLLALLPARRGRGRPDAADGRRVATQPRGRPRSGRGDEPLEPPCHRERRGESRRRRRHLNGDRAARGVAAGGQRDARSS